MPLQRKNLRRRIRKNKRANRRGRKIAVTRIVQRTLPDKLLVKLPYTDLQGLSGTGPSNQKSYNVNSCYDPETGAINDQNLGFDQYMALYGKYRVYKVTYQVTMYNISNSAVAGSLNFSEQGQQMNLADIQHLQLPYSRRFTLAPSGNTGSMKTIKGSIWLPRVVGLTPEQYRTNDKYVGSGGSSPAGIIQMSMNFININVNLGVGIQADVRYTSYCELFDRVNILSTQAPPEPVLPLT